MLLAAGASLDARDNEGRSVIHLASVAEHTDMVRWLAERGADVNAADRQPATALHVAAQAGRHDMCGTLLSLGADVDALTKGNMTALVIAVMGNHQQVSRGSVQSNAQHVVAHRSRGCWSTQAPT